MPHGEWGKVINVRLFSRDKGDDLPARVNQWVQVWVAQKRKISVGDKLAGRHGNKGVISIIAPAEDMPFLPDGTPVDIILNPIGVPSRMNLGQVLETHLGWAAQLLGFRVMTPVFDGATDVAIEDALAWAWLVQKANPLDFGLEEGDAAGRVEKSKEWVSSHGYDAEQVFGDKQPGKAREISLRLWLQEQGTDARKFDLAKLEEKVNEASHRLNLPSPIAGKVILRDGRSGEPFDQPVTVGNMYILKLIHLVEDKVHARATGPYSLISQQPLGGKAQFGGQRFGEMEVWTLEAYGAAHNLQEMLTIKSDDVTGRAKTYEAIVKGEDVLQPGVPESFKVLVKELQSLGLAVEVINEEEKLAPTEQIKEITTSAGEPEVIDGQAESVLEAPSEEAAAVSDAKETLVVDQANGVEPIEEAAPPIEAALEKPAPETEAVAPLEAGVEAQEPEAVASPEDKVEKIELKTKKKADKAAGSSDGEVTRKDD
jgi:DNA-directed RNA polymerase subunit beta